MSALSVLLMEVIPMILVLIAGYLIANFSAGYLAWKDVIAQFAAATRAFSIAVDSVDGALEDDQITEEEFRTIFEHMLATWSEFRRLSDAVSDLGIGSFISGLFFGIFRPGYRTALVSRIPVIRRW